MSFKTFCSCNKRDVPTHCTIQASLEHTPEFAIAGRQYGRRSFSCTLLSDAAQRKAVLYGQIRRAGAPSAPETPDGTRNLKTILPATWEFHTDGRYVQLSTEQMFWQHRFPCKIAGQSSHAEWFFRSRNLTCSFASSCRTRPFPSELRQKGGT